MMNNQEVFAFFIKDVYNNKGVWLDYGLVFRKR